MQCPYCGTRTEVCEKRGPFRDRRCTNPACLRDFTTCEQIMSAKRVIRPWEHGRLCARTRALQSEAPARPAARVKTSVASSPGYGEFRALEKNATGTQKAPSYLQAGAAA
jgi:hypothetical protein